MECGIPECRNQGLDDFRRKMETVDNNNREHVLNVVHEPGEHPDDNRPDEQKRSVNLNLAHQSSRSLVFPDHVEVGFEAAEREDERDEKTASTDEPEFTDRNMFRIFDDIHNLLGRPVQIEHVNDDGEVVRNKITEPDCKRNRSEHDKQGDNGHKRCVCQRRCTRHSVIIQERLARDNHDFHKCGRSSCDVIEQPFPRKIFPPVRHTRR